MKTTARVMSSLAATVLCLLPAAAPVRAATFLPGAPGAGDPYFPLAGNGGYDVGHYDLTLRYDPAARRVTGTTEIMATATQDLSRFDLDLLGLEVGGVTVDGRAASYTRSGQELVISPAAGLRQGRRFRVTVSYAGSPQTLTGSDLGRTGWLYTGDGAVTLSQPVGSATWFPVNDHPSDKATYTFHVTVPQGLTVLANGEPAGRAAGGGTETFSWRSAEPMASYLAMLAIGHFKVATGRTPGGLLGITAVDDGFAASLPALTQATAEATDWEVRTFGAFPFGSTGGIVDDSHVDYALETQTRPVYGDPPDHTTVVHELAHQWFGDSVSVASWKDIWLNEGFATYVEWLWDEQHGGPPAQQRFDRLYAIPADFPDWRIAPGDPGPQRLFAVFPVYHRGAMTLHAVRTAVGDAAFFTILRTWVAEHRHRTASTADFRALAERVSGRPLGPIFDRWLYTAAKPVR
ncbi:M1 family metallopeptidase [Actinomadura scrupuli]|uniref:M1 family metallopeptidase n=1 Tax=Actinomadura scrupuli TaxID=559629 RepID=UPI003D98F483